MRILLAIDASTYSEAATDELLAHVRPAETEVLVLHVAEWPLGGPPYLTFGVGAAAINGVLVLRDQALEAAHALVDRIATRLRTAGFAATGTVREGEARSTIVDAATSWHADLIIMGSHGRRGLDRVALGSVAESVLRRATCSVEIVRTIHHLPDAIARTSPDIGAGTPAPRAAAPAAQA